MPRLQHQPAVAFDEHGNRRDHSVKAAPRRHEVQLGHERAARMLGAPGAGAPRRGQHHRAAAAAGQADLGFVPVANARVVGAARAVDLRGAQKRQVHAAARAQIVEVFVREDRRRVLGQHRIGAGQRNVRRPRVHAAGHIDIDEVPVIRALGQQAGQHGHRGIDAAERNFIGADEARQVGDDVRKARPLLSHDFPPALRAPQPGARADRCSCPCRFPPPDSRWRNRASTIPATRPAARPHRPAP